MWSKIVCMFSSKMKFHRSIKCRRQPRFKNLKRIKIASAIDCLSCLLHHDIYSKAMLSCLLWTTAILEYFLSKHTSKCMVTNVLCKLLRICVIRKPSRYRVNYLWKLTFTAFRLKFTAFMLVKTVKRRSIEIIH